MDRLRTALDDGHLLRLRETQILTGELERLTEELHLSRAEAANLHSRVDQVAAADEALAAAQAAEAELAALRIRHFDELHDLRDEVDWTTRALDTARQAEAEATARADQAIAEQTRRTARLAAEAKAAEAARAQLDKLEAETARRDAQRLVQVKLRGWQVEWLLAQGGRLGRRNGPSGVHLKKLPTTGPRVVQGPGENAGAVDIGDGLCAVFKMESHNHPSFIEPYQGSGDRGRRDSARHLYDGGPAHRAVKFSEIWGVGYSKHAPSPEGGRGGHCGLRELHVSANGGRRDRLQRHLCTESVGERVLPGHREEGQDFSREGGRRGQSGDLLRIEDRTGWDSRRDHCLGLVR